MRDQCRGVKTCAFIDACGTIFILCVRVCVSVVKQEPVPVEETLPIFPELFG